MNKSLFITTAVASILVFSTENAEAISIPKYVQPTEINCFCSDNSFLFYTPSSRTIENIESEIDSLHEDDFTSEVFDIIIQSSEKLKSFLANENMSKSADVIVFHKGYVGLTWETKDNKTIFLYALPNDKLFFNMVGENDFSERFTVDATKENFSSLISKINPLV